MAHGVEFLGCRAALIASWRV